MKWKIVLLQFYLHLLSVCFCVSSSSELAMLIQFRVILAEYSGAVLGVLSGVLYGRSGHMWKKVSFDSLVQIQTFTTIYNLLELTWRCESSYLQDKLSCFMLHSYYFFSCYFGILCEVGSDFILFKFINIFLLKLFIHFKDILLAI